MLRAAPPPLNVSRHGRWSDGSRSFAGYVEEATGFGDANPTRGLLLRMAGRFIASVRKEVRATLPAERGPAKRSPPWGAGRVDDLDAIERFTGLYDRYRNRVYAYAVTRAGRQLADEGVSEVFL